MPTKHALIALGFMRGETQAEIARGLKMHESRVSQIIESHLRYTFASAVRRAGRTFEGSSNN